MNFPLISTIVIYKKKNETPFNFIFITGDDYFSYFVVIILKTCLNIIDDITTNRIQLLRLNLIF